MKIKFKATKVFEEIWDAINKTFINEKGLVQRVYRLIEEVGGSRSSKTWSNFQVIFLYAIQNKLKTITIMRDTAQDCRDKVETEWIDWLKDPNRRVKEFEDEIINIEELDLYLIEEDLSKFFIQNKSKHTWTCKETGSIITFTGTDDEDRAIGKGQNVLWVNEPYKFSEEVFKQLSQRTKDFILVDWNPKQNHFIEKLRLKKDTFTHLSTLLDNPFCPLESRKQILSYQPIKYFSGVVNQKISEIECYSYDIELNKLNFTPKEIRELCRCLENESTLTASEYHYKVYMLGEKAEKPNRIFKNWKTITDKEFDSLPYSLYYGMDFGLSAPSTLVAMKFDGDNSFFFKELLYKPMNQMNGTLSDEIHNLGIDKRLELICDSSNEINKTEGQKLRNSGYNVIFALKGKGSVVSGIELLQKKNIYYTASSTNIEQEYEQHSWRVVQGVQLDEPEQGNDHALDAMKYVSSWYARINYLT